MTPERDQISYMPAGRGTGLVPGTVARTGSPAATAVTGWYQPTSRLILAATLFASTASHTSSGWSSGLPAKPCSAIHSTSIGKGSPVEASRHEPAARWIAVTLRDAYLAACACIWLADCGMCVRLARRLPRAVTGSTGRAPGGAWGPVLVHDCRVRIGPRYGSNPLIVLDGDPAAVVAPLLGQRRRLAAALAGFDEAAWSAQSRCAAWNNRDVVVHLTITNRFWAHSIAQARLGRPTRMLTDFDPVADPANLVRATPRASVADTLAWYRSTTEALGDCLVDLRPQEWALPAESPLGHVPISVLAHHALWDGWVHERDIAAGVGSDCPTVDDEVRHALRFVAAFAPALDLVHGASGASHRAAIVTSEPDVAFTVEVDDRVRVTDGVALGVPVAVRGRTTDILEGLSVRTALPIDPGYRWLTHGLRRTFESPSESRP